MIFPYFLWFTEKKIRIFDRNSKLLSKTFTGLDHLADCGKMHYDPMRFRYLL